MITKLQMHVHKIISGLLMLVFAIGVPGGVFAQLPVVEVELQAHSVIRYVDVSTPLTSSPTAEPNPEKAALYELTWLEISSPENIMLTLEIRTMNENKQEAGAYYINTGQFDFARAKPFNGRRQCLTLFQGAGNDGKETTGSMFTAWIGLSKENVEKLLVAYD
jgi:hypothetical protein